MTQKIVRASFPALGQASRRHLRHPVAQLLKQLTKALLKRALQTEMVDRLGHDKNEAAIVDEETAWQARSLDALYGWVCARTSLIQPFA